MARCAEWWRQVLEGVSCGARVEKDWVPVAIAGGKFLGGEGS